MRRVLLGVAFFLLSVSIVMPAFSRAQKERKTIRITYRGKYARVWLFFNGRKIGNLSRYGTHVLKVREGLRVSIGVRFRRYSRGARFVVSRDRLIIFKGPKDAAYAASQSAPRSHMRVWYKGNSPYVRIYINGRVMARIRKGAFRLFYLKSGKNYRIKALFRGRGAIKNVFLSSRPMTKVFFYRP